MKFIKSYRIFESTNLTLDKELKEFNITKYSLNEDGSIDCDQHVDLFNRDLDEIPFNFNRINGNFNISQNDLPSLKNCPKYIDGWFTCHFNRLSSLEFGPEYVGENYYCYNNKLTTLKGCVDEVYGYFDCSNNLLTSLEFCPMQVEGEFNCSRNKLTELDFSPFVRKNLFCKGMFKSEPEFFGHCENLVWD